MALTPEPVGIIGTLSVRDNLQGGTLSVLDNIRGTVTLPNVIGGQHYEGEYVVTPNFNVQTLETNGLLMDDDVTVEAIQVSRTSNPSGGTTVYIGGLI